MVSQTRHVSDQSLMPKDLPVSSLPEGDKSSAVGTAKILAERGPGFPCTELHKSLWLTQEYSVSFIFQFGLPICNGCLRNTFNLLGGVSVGQPSENPS